MVGPLKNMGRHVKTISTGVDAEMLLRISRLSHLDHRRPAQILALCLDHYMPVLEAEAYARSQVADLRIRQVKPKP